MDKDVWIAWQFDRPEPGAGVVQAFRRQDSFYESARFKLRGLDSKARYAVTSLELPGAQQEFTGTQLMEKGLRVELLNPPAAAVITYRKLD